MAVHNNRELAMALATPVDLDKKAVEHNTEQKKRATSHAEVLAKLQGEDSKRSYVDPRIVIARKNMRGADGAVPPRSRMRSAKHYPVCETVGFGDDKGRATCDYELHCVHPCRAAYIDDAPDNTPASTPTPTPTAASPATPTLLPTFYTEAALKEREKAARVFSDAKGHVYMVTRSMEEEHDGKQQRVEIVTRYRVDDEDRGENDGRSKFVIPKQCYDNDRGYSVIGVDRDGDHLVLVRVDLSVLPDSGYIGMVLHVFLFNTTTWIIRHVAKTGQFQLRSRALDCTAYNRLVNAPFSAQCSSLGYIYMIVDTVIFRIHPSEGARLTNIKDGNRRITPGHLTIDSDFLFKHETSMCFCVDRALDVAVVVGLNSEREVTYGTPQVQVTRVGVGVVAGTRG